MIFGTHSLFPVFRAFSISPEVSVSVGIETKTKTVSAFFHCSVFVTILQTFAPHSLKFSGGVILIFSRQADLSSFLSILLPPFRNYNIMPFFLSITKGLSHSDSPLKINLLLCLQLYALAFKLRNKLVDNRHNLVLDESSFGMGEHNPDRDGLAVCVVVGIDNRGFFDKL